MKKRIWAVVLLLLAVAVSGFSVSAVYGMTEMYGPTNGSLVDGATHGLGMGVLPLVLVGVLSLHAIFLATGSRSLRRVGILVPVLTLLAIPAAGAWGAHDKYQWVALDVPRCTSEELTAPEVRAAVRRYQDAFAELEHPAKFSGGGTSGVAECGAPLLDISGAEAEAFYRDTLPGEGWTVESGPGRLSATRDGLRFRLAARASEPFVVIGDVDPALTASVR